MSRNFWNRNPIIQGNAEIVSHAEKTDYIHKYKGYYFLLQRDNDINNVIWVAVKPHCTVKSAFIHYMRHLKKRKIRYVTITTTSLRRLEIYDNMLDRLEIAHVQADCWKNKGNETVYEVVAKLY